MKYVILVGDGMGDYPMAELGGKTPLEAAKTPHMDELARQGETPREAEAGDEGGEPANEKTVHANVRPAAGPGVPCPQGLPGHSISDATSARRERSPRISVTWP